MDNRMEKEQVLTAYLSGGITTRSLANKSGYSQSTISRWVIAEKKEMGKRELLKASPVLKSDDGKPADVKELQAALRTAELKISLLEAMIDISDEQFGTDIRKKAGTRRS